jgi:hypothetical protein
MRFLIVLMFLMSCRGLFEAVGPKIVAYLIQSAALVACAAYVFFKGPLKPFGGARVVSAMVFVLTVLLSLMLTSFTYADLLPSYFFSAFILFVYLGVMIVGVSEGEFSIRGLELGLLLLASIMFVVAQLQQLGVINYFLLPGNSYLYGSTIRPASLTGSYLHYPLLMAFLAFVALEVYFKHKGYLALAASAISFIAVGLSFSRSGYLMIIIAGLYCVRSFLNLAKLNSLQVALLLFAIPLFLSSLMLLPEVITDRLLKISDTTEYGNSERIDDWLNAFELWMGTHIVVGEYLGYASNTATNLSYTPISIPESSVLTMLLNLGLLGLISMYANLFMLGLAIDARYVYLRGIFWGALIQSFVYQSIEVFIFIFFMMLLPIISRALNQESLAKGR